MLEEIIDSPENSALLAFFGSATSRSFGLIELSARLDIPEQKLEDLLETFIKLKIVNNFIKKGYKFYIANQNNLFLNEIKQSLQKDKLNYVDELFLAIKKLGKINTAFLSGIFVAQPNLPVDLLVVGEVNELKLNKFLSEAETMIGLEINYTVMELDEFTNRYNTFDKFIKDIFDYPHITVVDNL